MQQVQVTKGTKTTRSRFSRGMVLAVSRRIVKVHNEDAWFVESETTEGKYTKSQKTGHANVLIFKEES